LPFTWLDAAPKMPDNVTERQSIHFTRLPVRFWLAGEWQAETVDRLHAFGVCLAGALKIKPQMLANARPGLRESAKICDKCFCV
jgi:hypothetical protein